MSKRALEEEVQFDLGKKKKVTVREFKGNPLVDIREYYTPKGDTKELPGKKGISLTLDQWKELVKRLPEIKKALGEVDDDEEPPKKSAKVDKVEENEKDENEENEENNKDEEE